LLKMYKFALLSFVVSCRAAFMPDAAVNISWFVSGAFQEEYFVSKQTVRFQFTPASENQSNVLEVSEAGFQTCDARGDNLVHVWARSDRQWTLHIDMPSRAMEAGTHYFISTTDGTGTAGWSEGQDEPGYGGRCLDGLKVKFVVADEHRHGRTDPGWNARNYAVSFLGFSVILLVVASAVWLCRRRPTSSQYQLVPVNAAVVTV